MDGEMDVDTENAVDCGLGEDRAYSNPGEEEEDATASDADEDGSSSSASLLESDSEVIPPGVDDAVAEHIDSVLGVWCCQNECLSKQSEGVTTFIAGYMKLSKDGQRTSLVTALSVPAGLSVEGQRHRSTGQHVRYAYCLPFGGEQNLYAIPHHGNTGNRNAKIVDEAQLKAFFTRLAEVHGDIVPVRFRNKKTKDGDLRRYYTIKEYRLLLAYFTWAMMHDWYLKWATDARVRIQEPSLTNFRMVLERLCPTIRIRSPRDNVCDACVIYRNTMGPEPTVEDTEAAVASHIADAKSMRHHYKDDCDAATYDALVTTIDFAQNIMLPHNTSTPSLWYFLSLISVSGFGIHSHPDKLQWKLIYSERKAKKGSTEVISMLGTYARMRNIYSMGPGQKKWDMYTDNCGGQEQLRVAAAVSGAR
ncbi:Hypothetical protein PHPALM_3549 [Phytophthora palmivora]|uniref:Uncharacterized protein n=1 Tax=Phytophthora palmivora TaxID=4796 RepID=A0A2P4YM37_9STRA|nr:Hypothetical protein PHPALM_3549 [Phytophthora palmivora]